MCSNADPAGSRQAANPVQSAETDLAHRLGTAIDALAIAACCPGDRTDAALAERLAQTWAMIAAADPELAARTARYGEGL
jgi:hypothetical protein